MKKTIQTYTWNEDLQRMESGLLSANPSAKDSPDDRKSNIDDTSFFLPRGVRRSEKWIANREVSDRKEREENERRIDEQNQPKNFYLQHTKSQNQDIPHNQNRVSDFEYNDGYLWVAVFGIVVFFLIGVFVVTHL